MLRSRRLLLSLISAALMVFVASVASAAPGPQGKGTEKQVKARLTWSVQRVERTLTPGGSATSIPVTLTSNVDLQNVTLRLPGGLDRVVDVAPATSFNLKANTPVAVTLTVSLPAGAAESQGGVVQVRVGKRAMPEALKVLVRVPGDTDDDAAKQDDKVKNAPGQAQSDKAKGQRKQ